MSAGTDDATGPRPALATVASRLLDAAATGDRVAFAELFDRFGALFSACVSTVQSDAAARDGLTAQAFTAVWRRAGEGARAQEPVLWLLEVLCQTLGAARELAHRPLGAGVLALTCPDRELLLLAVAGRYSPSEISALTGIPEPSLRGILGSCLASLRGGLDEGPQTA